MYQIVGMQRGNLPTGAAPTLSLLILWGTTHKEKESELGIGWKIFKSNTN